MRHRGPSTEFSLSLSRTMRVATRHQHPLHLQVTRNSNGKFFVSSNPQDQQQQQQQQPPHQLLQQQPQHHHHHRHHHHHHHHLHQSVQQVQAPSADDVGITAPVAPVAFPTCEPNSSSEGQHGPTIVGDRFLLIGPAEGSTLYRCVDVHTGQQLIAKVSLDILLFAITIIIYIYIPPFMVGPSRLRVSIINSRNALCLISPLPLIHRVYKKRAERTRIGTGRQGNDHIRQGTRDKSRASACTARTCADSALPPFPKGMYIISLEMMTKVVLFPFVYI